MRFEFSVALVPKTPQLHPVFQTRRFYRILGLDADVKDHGFAADRSGNPRDARRGEEIEITDLKGPGRQSEHGGLGVYVCGVVYVYEGTVGRIVRRQGKVFGKRGTPPEGCG